MSRTTLRCPNLLTGNASGVSPEAQGRARSRERVSPLGHRAQCGVSLPTAFQMPLSVSRDSLFTYTGPGQVVPSRLRWFGVLPFQSPFGGVFLNIDCMICFGGILLEGHFHQVGRCQVIPDCIGIQWLMAVLKYDLRWHNFVMIIKPSPSRRCFLGGLSTPGRA